MLYSANGDGKTLMEAVDAATWVMRNRSLADGGFRHDAQDAGGPYLGDSLAMARAFLQLYAVTGDS